MSKIRKPLPWHKRVVLIGKDAAVVCSARKIPDGYQAFGFGIDRRLPDDYTITIACPPDRAQLADPNWTMAVRAKAVRALLIYEDKAKSMIAEATDDTLPMAAWDP